jgi:hypothetical protein
LQFKVSLGKIVSQTLSRKKNLTQQAGGVAQGEVQILVPQKKERNFRVNISSKRLNHSLLQCYVHMTAF